MTQTIKNIIFWLNNARAYSLPITILSWLVIFIYSLKQDGSILCGILALFGICLVHLATNLIDDYFDYRILIKDEKFLNSAQNCKCAYLKSGKTNPHELKRVIIIFLAIAAVIGAVLFFVSGYYVALLAICALVVALIYQKLSLSGFGEIAVIFAYGPLLFEGVYYVMTKHFSVEVLILSFACAFFTNTILYAHMLMDFDGDECSHKTTLCRKFKTKQAALKFILVFYLVSYILCAFLAVKSFNYLFLLPLLTIPMVIDLYNSLRLYNTDKTKLHKIYPWHYPLDNWTDLSKTKDAPFYFNFFYSRNIMILFMLLTCIAIILR